MTDHLQIARPTVLAKPWPPSLFTGVMAAADHALGVRSIRHRSALTELGARRTLASGVVTAVHDVIARNLEQARALGQSSASRENWRWCRPQTYLGSGNTSPEVRLERAIAACGHGWANQIPICSGTAGPSADRRRAIDLVHQVGENHFQFIELKIASDTPLYAAIEIIGYGCVWLLSRGLADPAASELLRASKVDLMVLAPAGYYAPFQLHALGLALNDQVAVLGASMGVDLSFRFEVLPPALASERLPPVEDIAALLGQREAL